MLSTATFADSLKPEQEFHKAQIAYQTLAKPLELSQLRAIFPDYRTELKLRCVSDWKDSGYVDYAEISTDFTSVQRDPVLGDAWRINIPFYPLELPVIVFEAGGIG